MAKLNKNKVGLAVGLLVAILHAVWAILVAVGVGETVIQWIMPLHFIDMAASVFTFSIVTALLLIVVAFIGGYVIGWVYAAISNKIAK